MGCFHVMVFLKAAEPGSRRVQQKADKKHSLSSWIFEPEPGDDSLPAGRGRNVTLIKRRFHQVISAAAAAARMKVTVVTGRRKRRRIRRRQITRLHQGVAVAVIIITGVHFAVAAIDVVAIYGCVVDIYDRRTGTTMIVAVVEDVVTVAYVVT